MIVNYCIKQGKVIDEKICKHCKDKSCEHAEEFITKEKLDMAIYGTKEYWEDERDY